VDVVLVLLIILMVASTYIVSQTLKVQLPKSHSTDGAADKPMTITLQTDGKLRWNDEITPEVKIVANLKEVMARDPDTNVVVSADKDVKHGNVVHILDIAKLAGVTKFAINVQGE